MSSRLSTATQSQPSSLTLRRKGPWAYQALDRNAVKKGRAVNPPHPAEQSQGRSAFLFAWADRLDIQRDIDFGTVNLGEDVTVIILGHLLLLAVGLGQFDLPVAAALAATTTALEGLVGIRAQEEQALSLA